MPGDQNEDDKSEAQVRSESISGSPNKDGKYKRSERTGKSVPSRTRFTIVCVWREGDKNS